MRRLAIVLGLAVALAGCSRSGPDPAVGDEVTLQKQDGVQIAGRLIEVQPEHVVIRAADGTQTTVKRAEIAEWRGLRTAARPEREATPAVSDGTAGARAAGPEADPDRETGRAADETPAADTRTTERSSREVTLPAGTVLPLTLRTSVGSDTSSVEDPVRATLRRAVSVDGVEVLPAGTAVIGHVTNAKRSAKVKGRGEVAFRFTRLDLPGEGGVMNIRTGTVVRVAPATKKRDAATIGGGAVGGAIIGGIVGGGDGAAKGAAIGGAAGTGAVLATRGAEVRLAAGAPVSVRLTAPVLIRVRD